MRELGNYLKAFAGIDLINIVGPFSQVDSTRKEPIIFVDGGSQFRIGEEGYSVGDGDSFSGQLDCLLPMKKNYSDLSYVLNSLSENFSEVSLSGFLGGRRDHEILNLGEVHHFLKGKENIRVYFDDQVTAVTQGRWKFNFAGIFSLIALESTRVLINGQCEYGIENMQVLPLLSSWGLSNIARGDFEVTAEGPIFLFWNR